MFTVNEKREFGKWFSYEDASPIFDVKVRYITDHEINEIQKKSTKPRWVKRQRVDETDEGKFRKLVGVTAILDIKGLKFKQISTLIEPHYKLEIDLPPGKTLDDEITYSKELRDLLAEYMHVDFGLFLLNASRDTKEFHEQKKAEEKENLSSGSGTKPVKKG